MGWHLHHAMIVTTFDGDQYADAHALAVEFFGALVVQGPTVTNGFRSFVVVPDGSKEGWDESDHFDVQRKLFRRELRTRKMFVDWVEVAFGGDEGETNTRIVDHSANWPEPVGP